MEKRFIDHSRLRNLRTISTGILGRSRSGEFTARSSGLLWSGGEPTRSRWGRQTGGNNGNNARYSRRQQCMELGEAVMLDLSGVFCNVRYFLFEFHFHWKKVPQHFQLHMSALVRLASIYILHASRKDANLGFSKYAIALSAGSDYQVRHIAYTCCHKLGGAKRAWNKINGAGTRLLHMSAVIWMYVIRRVHRVRFITKNECYNSRGVHFRTISFWSGSHIIHELGLRTMCGTASRVCTHRVMPM